MEGGVMKSRIVVLSLVVALVACAKRVPPTNTFEAKGFKVGNVEVSTGELPTDRENRANKIQLETQVKERTLATLRARSLFDSSSPVTMVIHINEFRLRHGATRYFTGFFSGSDRLAALLTVSDTSTKFLSKQIEVSGGNGNPFAISSDSRGANLSNDLASLAVASLQRDEVHTEPVALKASVPPSTTKQKVLGDKTSAPAVSSCSVEQVLLLREKKFSDQQIKAACSGNAQ
jgi:hypothetical protein